MSESTVEEIGKKLTSEIEEATWEMLKDHFEKGSILYVSMELDLVEVGIQLALDNVDTVQAWASSNKVGKPSDEKVQAWEEDSTRKFSIIIVQPFVVIQEKMN